VLQIASLIILELKDVEAIPLPELDEKIQDRVGEEARINFLPALDFLFLTGKIDYDVDSDAVFLT
jgi:hypothetical protein